MEYRDTAREFLGKGWSFPVQVDEVTGTIRSVSSEEDIRQAVRLILQTNKGERVMNPEFGCNLRQYMFGQIDYTTCTQMEQEVRDALIRWEPRITDVEVQVELSDENAAQLLVKVSYVVRSTNNYFNMVYPYYINEGLEG